MKITQVAKANGGQDGAIFGDLVFRFDASGNCRVYSAEALFASSTIAEPPSIAEFTLDKTDVIVPHSNAVAFGSEYYEEGDEFPILYTNVYNNYKNEEDKLPGVLSAYRIQRCGDGFASTLVQVIKVGFTEDRSLWLSSIPSVTDARPYGNFAIDTEKNRLYAFVMRDGDKETRYFSFCMPSVHDGVYSERFGVNTVTLNKEDALGYFDTPYHNYVQGACLKDGRIYSVEGFNEKIHPAIRIIDLEEKRQIFFADFADFDVLTEAEFIDFWQDRCYYSDHEGRWFLLEF